MEIEIKKPFCMAQVITVPDALPELAARAARIKALEIEARHYAQQGLDYEAEAAAAQAAALASEREQLAAEIAHNLWRKNALTEELKRAGGPLTIRAMLPGEKPTRPKREVLTDLTSTVRWLAVWMGDADLAQEAATLEAQLAEAYAAA